jgi:hypothetical protein
MAYSTWFREEIKGMVRDRYKSKGGYLDGTMTKGESSAGTVKFPVGGGRIDMVKLTGSIQRVNPSNTTLDMVTLTTDDYEASTYFRTQDEARMGPSLKAKLASDLAGAVRRKRDNLKLAALNTFAASGATTLTDAPTSIQTIGDGSARVDILHAITITDQIVGAGSDDECFWAIPQVWMSQLCMYKEFQNADYTGPTDLPMASRSKVKKKTFNGVHIFSIPDEHFIYGTGAYVPGTPGFTGSDYLDTFAWTQESMGEETWWDEENMKVAELPELEGTPSICKVSLSSAAVGINPEGVKRIRMLAIKTAIRPS